MCLVSTVFSGLSALVIEDVQDAGEVICVRARTPGRAVACPGCGKETASVHGYHEATAPGMASRRFPGNRRPGSLTGSWVPSGLSLNFPSGGKARIVKIVAPDPGRCTREIPRRHGRIRIFYVLGSA